MVRLFDKVWSNSRDYDIAMAAAISFEGLIAWQKARELTAHVYRASGTGALGKDFRLKDQIRGASVSVMSNIAEGFERARPAEFHQFLSTAKGSCGEVRSHLYVAFDAGYLNEAEFAALRESCNQLSRIIGGLRASVQRKRDAAKASHSP